ncbi:MAG TPA: TetR family transcriptional regulator [Pseudonocardiaceae bacterium]|nr:TetR family transcriptional regulator [Pseudonocardiaceae bacterium]
MPTGVHIRDAREQLFHAAERVLLRDGPSALTSRAVTEEAGVAKGVLHRHFTDFDDFLAQLVHNRAQQVEIDSIGLHTSAGTNTVVDNIAATLAMTFETVAVAIVALIIFRDELRTRLRESWPTGVPILADAVNMLDAYLRAEQTHGRVARDADTISIARTLIGAAHLLFADRKGIPPTSAEIRTIVANALR